MVNTVTHGHRDGKKMTSLNDDALVARLSQHASDELKQLKMLVENERIAAA